MFTPPPDLDVPKDAHLRAVVYDANHAPYWQAVLSVDERQRLDGFGAASRQREFLSGRIAARHLVADRLACAPEDVPLRVADDGAVDVPGTSWHLSISHTGPSHTPRAVAICALQPVGLDLEQIQPRSPRIRQFLFAPSDRALPDALPYSENSALLLCWTLKEAVLKARRSGFRCSPKAIRLSVDAATATATAQVESTSWTLCYARWHDTWCAAAWQA